MASVPRPIVLHYGPGRNAAFDDFIDRGEWTVIACVADADLDCAGEMPPVSFAEWHEHLRAVPSAFVALDPRERHAQVERVHKAGGTIAHVDVIGDAISRKTSFGEATLVGRGALYVGSLTTVGRHTIVMTPASLGHDVVIGNFVTIFPSAAISGYVIIEDDVTIGLGAVIANGQPDRPLRIGAGARIASGAVVMRSVRPGLLVAGNPARPVTVLELGHERIIARE